VIPLFHPVIQLPNDCSGDLIVTSEHHPIPRCFSHTASACVAREQ
jgi:hypothetical protein